MDMEHRAKLPAHDVSSNNRIFYNFESLEKAASPKLTIFGHDGVYCRQRGGVVRSVVFTTVMIARLMVRLPPKYRCCALG